MVTTSVPASPGTTSPYDAVATITKQGFVAKVYHWENGSWHLYERCEPVPVAAGDSTGEEQQQ